MSHGDDPFARDSLLQRIKSPMRYFWPPSPCSFPSTPHQHWHRWHLVWAYLISYSHRNMFGCLESSHTHPIIAIEGVEVVRGIGGRTCSVHIFPSACTKPGPCGVLIDILHHLDGLNDSVLDWNCLLAPNHHHSEKGNHRLHLITIISMTLTTKIRDLYWGDHDENNHYIISRTGNMTPPRIGLFNVNSQCCFHDPLAPAV